MTTDTDVRRPLTQNPARAARGDTPSSAASNGRDPPIDLHVPTPKRLRRLLMVAYVPPVDGSGGIQRTLRLVQQFPLLGLAPIVLMATPRAYDATGADLDAEVPPGTVLERAFALDSARHLSMSGRNLAALAQPGRWMAWRFVRLASPPDPAAPVAHHDAPARRRAMTALRAS